MCRFIGENIFSGFWVEDHRTCEKLPSHHPDNVPVPAHVSEDVLPLISVQIWVSFVVSSAGVTIHEATIGKRCLFHTGGGKTKSGLFRENTNNDRNSCAAAMLSLQTEMVLGSLKQMHLLEEFQSRAWWEGSRRETPRDKQGTAAEECTPAACTPGSHTGPQAARAGCTHLSPHCCSRSYQRMYW